MHNSPAKYKNTNAGPFEAVAGVQIETRLRRARTLPSPTSVVVTMMVQMREAIHHGKSVSATGPEVKGNFSSFAAPPRCA